MKFRDIVAIGYFVGAVKYITMGRVAIFKVQVNL